MSEYNAATHFIDRHLTEGRGDKAAFIDDRGTTSYALLAARVSQAARALARLGVQPEQRVMLAVHDGVEFPVVFFGAMKLGAVPVPINTLLPAADVRFMLRDSRARAFIVSRALHEKLSEATSGQPALEHVLVAEDRLATAIAHESDAHFAPAATTRDDVAFWLYSSGSTGQPKGAMHLMGDLEATARLYAEGILAVRDDDVFFSAPKLFFAYGLGNGMTFPLHAGATAVLMAERPTPESVAQRIREHRPTLFFGVPTLYAAMLAADGGLDLSSVRHCVSAGEALPADLAVRWRERHGVDILDGIGSTELLHIFLSNRPGDVRPGSSGKVVEGYELRLADEQGAPVAQGEIGELLVKGPTAAVAYWNQREKSLATFEGRWTRTGDKYRRDEDGYYIYAGRADDMLKVSGIWVSPFEIESALASHPSVQEAAVVGHLDDEGLVKPKAFVVLTPGATNSEELLAELKAHVKAQLAPYKYPRTIEVVADLPKTATGKIRRFLLRAR
jgi:benzoate-CoA ligase family protein